MSTQRKSYPKRATVYTVTPCHRGRKGRISHFDALVFDLYPRMPGPVPAAPALPERQG